MWGWVQSAYDFVSGRQPETWATPSREDRMTEKVKGGPRIPLFLPFYDQFQNLSETETMRLNYRKMLSDPNIKAALLGKLFGVMGMDLKIHPANDKARFREHADFIQWNLTTRLAGGLPGLVWNILMGALLDGYSVSEKVWTIQDGKKYKLKKVLRELKSKDTNQDIVLQVDEYRNIWAVMGLRYNAGELWSPKEFLIYSHLGLFGNPTGMSDLRAAYSRYWILDTVTKLRAMGAEKRAFPIITGEYPDPSKQSRLEAVLSQIRYSNWFAVPKDVKLQVMDIAGKADDYFTSFRRDCQEEIFLSIQLATLQSLTGGAGTMRGASAVHKDTADLAKWMLSNAICTCLNDHENGLIPDMLEANFRDVSDYCYATMTGIDDAALAESLRVDEGLLSMNLPLSKKHMYTQYGRPQPENEEDALTPLTAGGEGGGGDLATWIPGSGSRGGKKWTNAQTGKTKYSKDRPNNPNKDLDKLITANKQNPGQVKFGESNGHMTVFTEWTSFRGPRGGIGWRSSKTGEVLYQKEKPTGREKGEGEDGGEEGEDPSATPEGRADMAVGILNSHMNIGGASAEAKHALVVALAGHGDPKALDEEKQKLLSEEEHGLSPEEAEARVKLIDEATVKMGMEPKEKEEKPKEEKKNLDQPKKEQPKKLGNVSFRTSEVHEAATNIFGKELKESDYHSMVGATPDAKVDVMRVNASSYGGVGDALEMTVIGNGYEAIRHIFRNKQGNLVANNESIQVTDTGKGLGTEIFSRQVDGLVKMGVGHVKCHAVRGKDFNGHYTWVRLGYNGPLPKGTSDDFQGAATIQDFVAKPGGMEYWKQHGESFHGVFDLKEGSRSRKILDAYKKAKGSGVVPTKGVKKPAKKLSRQQLHSLASSVLWGGVDTTHKKLQQTASELNDPSMIVDKSILEKLKTVGTKDKYIDPKKFNKLVEQMIKEGHVGA